MKDSNKRRSDILSDHALERVMRDVFSGYWSPCLDEPDAPHSALATNVAVEEKAEGNGGLQSLQLQTVKPGA
jgi:hypothetical protein